MGMDDEKKRLWSDGRRKQEHFFIFVSLTLLQCQPRIGP